MSEIRTIKKSQLAALIASLKANEVDEALFKLADFKEPFELRQVTEKQNYLESE